MWRERFTSSTGANAPVDDDLARGHSVVAESLPPPWVSGTEVPCGNPLTHIRGKSSLGAGFALSQAAGRRRIAYVRPPRRSPLPAHQRAFQSSGDGVGQSMGLRGGSGDKFFGVRVNGMEMVAGMELNLRPPLTLPSPRTLRLRGEEDNNRACLTSQGRTVLLPLPASAGRGEGEGRPQGRSLPGLPLMGNPPVARLAIWEILSPAHHHPTRNLPIAASLKLTPSPGASGTAIRPSSPISKASFVNSHRNGDWLVEYSAGSSSAC